MAPVKNNWEIGPYLGTVARLRVECYSSVLVEDTVTSALGQVPSGLSEVASSLSLQPRILGLCIEDLLVFHFLALRRR